MESRLNNFQLCWSFQMVKISEYWHSIFFVSCCKTLLTSKTVSYYLLIYFAGATNWWTFWPLQMPWKWISKAFLFCVGSLLHYFRFRIREQTFQPDLGPVSPLRISHLVAHLLINTNLLTFYVSVFFRKNILNSSLSCSKSSETNPWYGLLCFSASHGFTHHFFFLVFETLLCFLLCFINCEHAARTQRAPSFLLFSRCSPLLC